MSPFPDATTTGVCFPCCDVPGDPLLAAHAGEVEVEQDQARVGIALQQAHPFDGAGGREHFVAALLQVGLVERQHLGIVFDGEDLVLLLLLFELRFRA